MEQALNDTYTPNKDERIVYCDFFDERNSNPHWRRTFEQYVSVTSFDVVREPIQKLWPLLCSVSPTHIHLGGSVKDDAVPVRLLQEAKRKFQCTISHFYGDPPFPSYCLRTGIVADAVYTSNISFTDYARLCDLQNFEYMPCPTDPAIFHPVDTEKQYDVIFIGNNNEPTRRSTLDAIHEHYNLTVFGADWERTSFHLGGLVYNEEFGKVVSSARVVLSVVGDRWKQWKAYFSNRLINSLACGGVVAQTYTPGLEDVFENGKHLFWYNDIDELLEIIDRVLKNDDLQRTISVNAVSAIQKYTYDNTILRVLRTAHERKESSFSNFRTQPTVYPVSDRTRYIGYDSIVSWEKLDKFIWTAIS
jgi:glycosyltransferase involved in cell wall biosynthesis